MPRSSAPSINCLRMPRLSRGSVIFAGPLTQPPLADHALDHRFVELARAQQHQRLFALRRAGALDAADRHIEFLLGEHFLHRRRHAAGRRKVLAVFAALLHVAGGHRLGVDVLRLEHGIQLVERQHIIRADLPRVLVALDLALLAMHGPMNTTTAPGCFFLMKRAVATIGETVWLTLSSSAG